MKRVLSLIFTAICCLGLSVAAENYQVRASNNGMSIKCNLDLSLFSRFILVEPPWGYMYFWSVYSPTNIERTDLPDGKYKVNITPKDGDTKFKIDEYSASVYDDKVVLKLRAELLKDMPMHAEYSIMMIPAALVENARIKTETLDGETADFVLPQERPKDKVVLGKNLKHLVLETSMGVMTLHLDHGDGFGLVDRRGFGFDPGTDAVTKGLWVGVGRNLQFGTPFDHQLTVTFEPSDLAKCAEPFPVAADAKAVPKNCEDLVEPVEFESPWLPQPQHVELNPAADFAIPENVTWNVAGATNDSEGLERFSRAANRLLPEIFAAEAIWEEQADKAQIQIKLAETLPEIDGDEGYLLQVEQDGVHIQARTFQGAFYALQTLRGRRVGRTLPGMKVVDWPDMAWRGALIMVDNKSLQDHGEIIKDVFARLKYNYLVIECEYAAWDTLKTVRQPWAISKDDLRELIRIAKDNYLTVIPLVQSLGHSEYLFKNGQNAHLAENNITLDVYNASHPDIYPLMTRLLNEVVELFDNPKYLHIGHDEVGTPLNYPTLPENKAKGGAQMILDDIAFYYKYCKEHGMRMMLWQDMFVDSTTRNPDDAFGAFGLGKRLDEIPKDVIFTFWNYGTDINQHSLALLREKGFDILCCPWYRMENHRVMAESARRHHALGILSTFWAGYNDFAMKGINFKQFAGYLPGGSRSWNGKEEANDYPLGATAYAMIHPEADDKPSAGWMLDLSAVANLSLAPENHPLLAEPLYGLDEFPQILRVGSVKFAIPYVNGAPAALALKSRCTPQFPESVSVPLPDIEAGTIYILHSMRDNQAMIWPGSTIVTYQFEYADGTMETVPMRHPELLLLMTEDDTFLAPPTQARARQSDGVTVHDRYWKWRNPHPEKVIRKITVQGTASQFPYFVHGISYVK